jgi:site-specific DNA-methyltransferase (adenine-specific)
MSIADNHDILSIFLKRMVSTVTAPNNRTLTLSDAERTSLRSFLEVLAAPASIDALCGKIFCQDCITALPYLPSGFVDVLILDPPYNLTKSFNGTTFRARNDADYTAWMESWFQPMMRLLKPTASVYICGDWKSSASIVAVAEKYLHIQNRITWEREKGRGAKANWKNCSEDIWFCTMSDKYTFNADAVRLRRRVIAPYRENGSPKDWQETGEGNFRDTAPSNLWTDITVPFWSMPENTDHPTQKPEKLIAKLLLASSNAGDVVLDPFAGSGTTAVVAKKLGRQFVAIEQEEEYCLWALKRLESAENDATIQGLTDGVFWERNSLQTQPPKTKQFQSLEHNSTLFE